MIYIKKKGEKKILKSMSFVAHFLCREQEEKSKSRGVEERAAIPDGCLSVIASVVDILSILFYTNKCICVSLKKELTIFTCLYWNFASGKILYLGFGFARIFLFNHHHHELIENFVMAGEVKSTLLFLNQYLLSGKILRLMAKEFLHHQVCVLHRMLLMDGMLQMPISMQLWCLVGATTLVYIVFLVYTLCSWFT